MRNLIQRHRGVLWTLMGVTLVVVLVTGRGEDRVPASGLRVLLSGNTASGRTAQGSNFHVYYRPDGRMSGFAHSQHYDLGSWEITKDDGFCRQWTAWQHGLRVCFDIYRTGENQYRMISSHPRHEATFSVREGDPEDLKDRIGLARSTAQDDSKSGALKNQDP